MDHAQEARQLFLEGYNCAQAAFCAFNDLTGLDLETAARLASSFGAGMGRLREACGAVSGSLMALGMIRGYSDPADPTAKAAHYAQVQDYVRRFRERNGTSLCRELLRDPDMDFISLNVYLDNAPARRCYEKCGFTVTQINPERNNCRMELSRAQAADDIRSISNDV